MTRWIISRGLKPLQRWSLGYVMAYAVFRLAGTIDFHVGKSAMESDLGIPLRGHVISERLGSENNHVLHTNALLLPGEMTRQASDLTRAVHILFYPLVLLELPLHSNQRPARDGNFPVTLSWEVVQTKAGQLGIALLEPLAVEGSVLVYPDHLRYLIKTSGYPRSTTTGEMLDLVRSLDSHPGYSGGFLPAGYPHGWNLPASDPDLPAGEWSYTSTPDHDGAVEYWLIVPSRTSIYYAKIIPRENPDRSLPNP